MNSFLFLKVKKVMFKYKINPISKKMKPWLILQLTQKYFKSMNK
jgi:hypothetical protein